MLMAKYFFWTQGTLFCHALKSSLHLQRSYSFSKKQWVTVDIARAVPLGVVELGSLQADIHEVEA